MEGRRIFANTMKYVLMATSSNFGNMFSAAGASVFLSFLPMLPSQILLNNLLYNTGQLVIPTDRVDPEALARPAAWDMKFIRRFMSVFGPVSSIFDFLTFWVMLSLAPRRPHRVPDRLVRRVDRHPNPGRLRDPNPANPVLQEPAQPAHAVGADRSSPRRCDPARTRGWPTCWASRRCRRPSSCCCSGWSSSTWCWSNWPRPASTAPPTPRPRDLPSTHAERLERRIRRRASRFIHHPAPGSEPANRPDPPAPQT